MCCASILVLRGTVVSAVWANIFRQTNGTWYHTSPNLIGDLVQNEDGSISLQSWSMTERQTTVDVVETLQKIALDSGPMAAQRVCEDDLPELASDEEWDTKWDSNVPDVMDVSQKCSASSCMNWGSLWGTGCLFLSFLYVPIQPTLQVFMQDVCSFVSLRILGLQQDVLWKIR
jgi:hypothetical protein